MVRLSTAASCSISPERGTDAAGRSAVLDRALGWRSFRLQLGLDAQELLRLVHALRRGLQSVTRAAAWCHGIVASHHLPIFLAMFSGIMRPGSREFPDRLPRDRWLPRIGWAAATPVAKLSVMLKLGLCKLATGFVLAPSLCLAEVDAPAVEVSDIRKVFDDGDHNAFTDMVVFDGAFYLTFRTCPDGHGVSPNAAVIVLRSDDGVGWHQVHRFAVAKRDTRDPHFLVFKRRLFVYTGTWYSGDAPAESNADLELNQHLGYAVWTADGKQWSEPQLLEGTFGHYVWRAASYGDTAFLCGRRKVGFAVGPKGEPNEIESLMLESEDGLVWRKRALFQETSGDETAFLFERDGSVLGIARRRSTAQLLRSAPPYEHWERRDLDRHIGGPLVARWGGRTIVGGRRATDKGPRTSLCWLVGDGLHEFAELPSGGDNSYPGFVPITPSEALVSWYSSHEGQASIYAARLKISTDTSAFDEKQIRALAYGDALLSFQRRNGGFPKGVEIGREIAAQQKLENALVRNLSDTSLDNGATHRQIRDLARAFSEAGVIRLRHGCEAGIDFLLEAQYENGGWPQWFPNARGYHRHITFNDGAMVGALTVLRAVARGEEPYAWVDDQRRQLAAAAVARGIDCILRCQIIVDGKRTAWGQQHDEVTLAPRPARAFEPASICSSESVGVIEFLMGLDPPTPEVVEAVEAAVGWLDGPAKLVGSDLDPESRQRVFADRDPGSVWSRLYEIGTNRPVFGDRDGKVYYDVTEISVERRNGYSWYGSAPRKLLEEKYPAWRDRIGK